MPAKARGGNSGVAAAALLTSVLAMPHERQVALLSDALLREYMHRRGFLATLKAFDLEHPRDADTIASRALMADLLALREQDMQRLKSQNNSSSSSNNDNDDADKNDSGASSSRAWTMMELLCALRVERQREVQRLRAAAAALVVPTVPEHYKQLIAAAEQQQQQQQQASPRGDDDNSNTDRTTSSEAAAVTTTQQRVRRSHHRRRRHDNDDGRLLRRSGRALTTALLDDAAATGMTMDELLGGSDDDDDNKGERGTKATATRGRDDNDGRADKQPAAAAAVSSANKDSNNKRNDDDNDDEGLDSGSDDEDVCLDGAVPLTVAEADELCVLLCGDNNKKGSSSYNDDADRGDNATASTAALPPLSFVQQGFVFDDACECALVQLRRGCDAVLAVVQAHVAAIYHEKQLYADVATRQRVCLQRALATMLLRAQPDVARVVLVDGGRNNNNNTNKSSGEEAKSGKGVASASPHTSRRANAQTALTPQQVVRRMRRGRFRVARGFASRDDLDAALARLLQAHWMATPRGCGLWCVLLSLVLSRGMSAVRADMTGATATAAVAASSVRALIDVARGVGTMALINLCLAGSAVCYTHDGTLRRLPGYAAKLTCGILCGDEDVDDDGSRSSGASRSVYGEAWCARRAVARDRATAAATTSTTSMEVTYTRATEPQHASWVVCHGERVVNVFMRKDVRRVVAQKRELGGAASAELLYWDAATDDDVRTLLVTVGSGGSGSAARRSVLPPPPPFLRNALRSVPLWRHATVEWADE